MNISNFFNEWKQKKEIIGKKLDTFLLEGMMKTEKEFKNDIFTNEYEKNNYEEYFIDKEEWKRKKEEEKRKQEEEIRKQIENEDIERRNEIVEGNLTKNEMLLIENEINRFIEWKIFD